MFFKEAKLIRKRDGVLLINERKIGKTKKVVILVKKISVNKSIFNKGKRGIDGLPGYKEMQAAIEAQ